MIIPTEKNMRRILAMHFAATKGGGTRFKIMMSLKSEPKNTNELSSELIMDYKTIQHHIRVLEKSGLIVSENAKYSNDYMVSDMMNQFSYLLADFRHLGELFNLRMWNSK